MSLFIVFVKMFLFANQKWQFVIQVINMKFFNYVAKLAVFKNTERAGFDVLCYVIYPNFLCNVYIYNTLSIALLNKKENLW